MFDPADVASVEHTLRLSEQAKDLTPKVRILAARAVSGALDRLCAEGELSYQELLDVRGEIRGVLAFSRSVDAAIKSGSILEEEEA
jgi:hypothetical protein